MLLWTLIITFFLSISCDGARILAFLPMPLHSHQNTYRPIMQALAKKGHDVTLVTSFPVNHASYKQIIVNITNYDEYIGSYDFYEMRKSSWFSDMFLVSKFFEETAHFIYVTPEIQTLVESHEQYDLVITESFMNQEAAIVLGHKFNCPVVELQALSPPFWLYHVIGNPYYFAYSVTFYTHSSDRMTFMERVHNTIMGVTTLLVRRYYTLPRQEVLADEYFRYPGWETRPPLLDLLTNISLVLQNTHIATHYSHPYNPNVIEIAGAQVQEPTKLPKDLQNYLDGAKEGVIYFSFGSIIQSSLMPAKTKQAFISAFHKIPYNILWKWEEDSFPNKPENVKISKWLPQAGVLAHPNVKAFITHGGLASMTEAAYHGVPLVVVPMFIDQLKNGKKVESAGTGVVLEFDNITMNSVIWSLNTVISQPSYREAAQKQSKLFRDNPLPPIDRAVYWIEYVLRHKGAPHLRTAATGLSWYKYYLIDVVAAITSIALLVLFLIYLVLRTFYRFIFCRSNKVYKKKQN